MQQEVAEIEKIVVWGLLAGFGGAVKYVSAVIRAQELVTNRRFMMLLGANMFISSFCGLMGAMLISTVTKEIMWHGLAAGMFGYVGTYSLDMTMMALQKKVGIRPEASVVIPLPSSVDTPPSHD